MAQASKTYEPEARDADATDNPSTPKLVWKQLSRWAWESECGCFRIERFITGDHIASRYRALKRTPEWWFEAAPSEGGLAAAQQACEALA